MRTKLNLIAELRIQLMFNPKLRSYCIILEQKIDPDSHRKHGSYEQEQFLTKVFLVSISDTSSM